VYAAEAIARAGVRLPGTIEISGTVDEESGGFAGVAWLAGCERIAKARTDYVIIPEPLNVDRICVGHRGVYWFELTTRGRVAHGSMPFLGVSAIDGMAEVLAAIARDLEPLLARRVTAMPVVPEGARHATINVNAIEGGQPIDGIQTPCVADRCRAVFDRRFLIEEGFVAAKNEIDALIRRAAVPGVEYSLRDLMVVEPVLTPQGSPVISALDGAIRRVLGAPASLVASPGTYDHKHIARIAGITDCVAYGPGEIELAHQPDESCRISDLVNATKVLALATLEPVSAHTRSSRLLARAAWARSTRRGIRGWGGRSPSRSCRRRSRTHRRRASDSSVKREPSRRFSTRTSAPSTTWEKHPRVRHSWSWSCSRA
jgi:succinyl-diaminopimelate desuccinylase